MGRPSNWNSPTDSVRLPKHAIPACMALARQLDDVKPVGDVKNNVQNPTGPYLVTWEVNGQATHYLVDPPADIPTDVWVEADRLLDEVCGPMSQKERWLMLGRMVEEWGKKVDG
jgi:hypothetical protein